MMYKLSQPNISEELIAEVTRVLRSGQLVQGKECEAFEKALSDFLGCSEVVLVSSGTTALYLALKALGVGPGDAILVPDFTFPATANAVMALGAKVVLVDVLPGTYTMNPALLENTIQTWQGEEKLRAIMPVHEFGCPANMLEIMRSAEAAQLSVIEDAACALGATYRGKPLGTFGEMGCFSFHPRKTLTTGEGGAIATNSSVLARRLRRGRNHGIERNLGKVDFLESALNYRLTDFQAAMGRSQLSSLQAWICHRQSLVAEYRKGLHQLQLEGMLTCPSDQDGHSWQTFMIVLHEKFSRSAVIDHLRLNGIEANLGAQSLNDLGLYGQPSPALTVGTILYHQGLALPLYEQLSEFDIRVICQILTSVLREISEHADTSSLMFNNRTLS